MLFPVILSGGAGTRLWPVSREAHPKPFMRMRNGKSLLQQTFARVAHLPAVKKIMTVTNRDYYFKTKDEYEELHQGALEQSLFLLEPFGRNTAPAIAMAALYIKAHFGETAVMLVLPADHLISGDQSFNTAIETACYYAEQDYLITFGVRPTEPETGFGYIKRAHAIDGRNTHRVERFTEKPGFDLAEEFVRSGEYYWNSGMFCFSVKTLLAELEKNAPDIYLQCLNTWHQSQRKVQEEYVFEIEAKSFELVQSDSIDYAVMEKAENVLVIDGQFKWSDIGSWNAVGDLTQPDDDGNRVVGEALLVDVANSYFQSENRLISAVGVEDLLVVDTADALLIAHKDRSQDVRKIVQQLKLANHESYKLHRTVNRPWGTYTVLEEGEGFKIKRIVVKPGASLSLQSHHHRSEHWVVVSGIAEVTNGDQIIHLKNNESTYIPAENKHRLHNPGLVEAVIIEVQTGAYLGEDDIVRYDDVYGRLKEANIIS